jgi:DNA-binding GntR family transcriptional regulator
MGTYVNKIALPEVLQGKFIRQTLEMRVVGIAARGFSRGIDQEFSALMARQREAAERHDVDLSFALDNEFHCLICRAAGLPKVWDVIQSATAQLDRMRRQAFLLDGFFMEVLTEHLELLTAIRALDAEEACRKMADHLDDIMESVRAIARDNPDMVEAGGIDLAAPPAF